MAQLLTVEGIFVEDNGSQAMVEEAVSWYGAEKWQRDLEAVGTAFASTEC